jgi:hypothetical protein
VGRSARAGALDVVLTTRAVRSRRPGSRSARSSTRRSAEPRGSTRLHGGFGFIPASRRNGLGASRRESAHDDGRQALGRQGLARRAATGIGSHSPECQHRILFPESGRQYGSDPTYVGCDQPARAPAGPTMSTRSTRLTWRLRFLSREAIGWRRVKTAPTRSSHTRGRRRGDRQRPDLHAARRTKRHFQRDGLAERRGH